MAISHGAPPTIRRFTASNTKPAPMLTYHQPNSFERVDGLGFQLPGTQKLSLPGHGLVEVRSSAEQLVRRQRDLDAYCDASETDACWIAALNLSAGCTPDS